MEIGFGQSGAKQRGSIHEGVFVCEAGRSFGGELLVPVIRVRDIDIYYEQAGQGLRLLFISGLQGLSFSYSKAATFFSFRTRIHILI